MSKRATIYIILAPTFLFAAIIAFDILRAYYTIGTRGFFCKVTTVFAAPIFLITFLAVIVIMLMIFSGIVDVLRHYFGPDPMLPKRKEMRTFVQVFAVLLSIALLGQLISGTMPGCLDLLHEQL